MSKITSIGALVVFALALGQGCKTDDLNLDEVNTEFNRKIVINAPLAKINFTVDGLLKKMVADTNVNIITGANDTLYYAFEKSIKLIWDDLVTLPDVGLNQSISPNSQLAGTKSATATTITGKLKLNAAGQRLDTVSFNKGELAINLDVPTGTSGSLSISIPELRHKGGIASFTTNVPFSSSANVIGLSDYIAIPSQSIGSSYLTVNVTPTFSGASPQAIGFELIMKNMGFDDAVGYFGQKSIREKNVELDFPFFDDFDLTDKIEFANFKIELESHNYLGVPLKVEADSVWLSKTKEPQNAWELQFSPKYMDLKSATYNGQLLASMNKFKVDKDNSPNIQLIGNRFPDVMACNITGLSNPNSATGKNFIKNNISIDNTLRLMFPLWFKTSNYQRTDTVKFDFNDLVADIDDETDWVDDLKIHFDFENRFPFEIKLNVVAVDGNNKAIVNIVPFDSTIAAAKPDEGGKTNVAVSSRISAVFDAEKIAKMKEGNVKNIIIYSEGVTYNNGNTFVVLFANSRMDLTVTLDLKAQPNKTNEP